MTATRITLGALAVMVAAALLPATATAQSSATPHQPRITDRIAANHFSNGNAYFQVARYEDAAREFQHAYDITHQPELLFNLGRAWESAGNIQAALDAYQRFSDAGAPGFDREILTARMANLRTRLPAAGAANASTSTTTTTTATTTTAEHPATTQPAAGTPATTEPATTTTPAATPAVPPVRHTHTVYERSALSSYGPIGLIALGVIAGGIGIAFGAIGLGASDTYTRANNGSTPWSQAANEAYTTAGTQMTVGLATGIAGGVFLLGGVAMLLLRGPGEPHEVVDAFVTPLPGGGAMVGVGGRL